MPLHHKCLYPKTPNPGKIKLMQNANPPKRKGVYSSINQTRSRMLTRGILFFLVACLRDVLRLSAVEPSHGSCSGGHGSIDQKPSCNIMFSRCPVVLCFEVDLVVSLEGSLGDFLGDLFTSLVSLFSHVFKLNGNVCSGSSSGLRLA